MIIEKDDLLKERAILIKLKSIYEDRIPNLTKRIEEIDKKTCKDCETKGCRNVL